MSPTNFTITWKPSYKEGKWWVEENIGMGGIHKIMFGPMPDRNTADALIEERRKMVQNLFVQHAQAMTARLQKPEPKKLVS